LRSAAPASVRYGAVSRMAAAWASASAVKANAAS
jgi:hypothetical protein